LIIAGPSTTRMSATIRNGIWTIPDVCVLVDIAAPPPVDAIPAPPVPPRPVRIAPAVDRLFEPMLEPIVPAPVDPPGDRTAAIPGAAPLLGCGVLSVAGVAVPVTSTSWIASMSCQ